MGFGIKIMPGVRISASRRGVRTGIGPRIARMHVGAGRVGFSTGAGPVSLWTGVGGRRRRRSGGGGGGGGGRGRALAPAVVQPPPPPPPAAPYEQAFQQAVQAWRSDELSTALAYARQAAVLDDANQSTADDLLAGLLCLRLNQSGDAIRYFARVVWAPITRNPDALMERHAPDLRVALPITEYFTMEVPGSSLAAGLLLAELYQHTGEREKAIELIDGILQIEPRMYEDILTLSLVDLHVDAGDWRQILELTKTATNQSSVSAALCMYKAIALAETGLPDAAFEAFKEALRYRKDRAPAVLHEALYQRARLAIEQNRKAQARRDLGRILAEDPDQQAAAKLLREITQVADPADRPG